MEVYLCKKERKEQKKEGEGNASDDNDEVLSFRTPDRLKDKYEGRSKINIEEVHKILQKAIADPNSPSKEEKEEQIDSSSVAASDDAPNKSQIILKGYLLKKNWFGSNQLRLFCMHENGEIKYYHKDALKGSILLDTVTQVENIKGSELVLKNIHSTRDKNKESCTLLQPQVKELKQAKGHETLSNDLDAWEEKLKSVIHGFSNPKQINQ